MSESDALQIQAARAVVIDRTILDQLFSAAPEDVYFLGGKIDRNTIAIQVLEPVEIIRKSSFFEVLPESALRALKHIEKIGLEPVGIFHTHVHGGDSPSPLDVLSMKKVNLVWLIRRGNLLRAWIFSDHRVAEIPLLTLNK